MRIVIGADHAGICLKVQLIELLKEEEYSVLKVEMDDSDPVDYSDYPQEVGEAERHRYRLDKVVRLDER